MNAVRKAAMLFSSLGKRDRAWVWKRLGPEERYKLSPLLDELAQLPGAALGADLNDLHASRGASSAPKRGDPSDSALLDLASAAEVVPLLIALPLPSVMLLLRMRNWTWSDDVLRGFGPDQRKQIKLQLAVAGAAQNIALAEWLVAQLAVKVRACREGVLVGGGKFDQLLGPAVG